jgi:tetratricopeptide (TPR) repeat protein
VPSANLTANELFEQARTLFGQKNFAAALEAYEKFKSDYGSSPEAKEALYNSLYPVAICYVQLLKFQEAIPAINEALAAAPPLPQRQLQDLSFWLGVAQMQQKDYPAARAAFEKFITLFPPGSEKIPNQIRNFPAITRIPEARSQIRMSYKLEGKILEADELSQHETHSSDVQNNFKESDVVYPTIGSAIEASRPENGTVFLQTARHSGGTLKTTNGTKWDANVKLVSPYRKHTFLSFYVHEGRTATITNIRANTYKLIFALGEGWDKRRGRFHRLFSTSAFETPLTISKNFDDSYSGYSITLNPVVDGNTHVEEISENEFLAY